MNKLDKTHKIISICGIIISSTGTIIGWYKLTPSNPLPQQTITTHSSNWLLVLSLFLLLLFSVYFFLTNKKKKKNVNIVVDGMFLTSLNMANLLRSVNKNFKVKKAYHRSIIRGQDIELEFEYQGVHLTNETEGFTFSIDSDNFIPFRDLFCSGYDLSNDPLRASRIKPILKSADGNSKKVLVPFLKATKVNDNFHVYMHCKLPNCVLLKKDYYFSTLSFADLNNIEEYKITLQFQDKHPEYVRVYEVKKNGSTFFKNEMMKSLGVNNEAVYEHSYHNSRPPEILIFFFERDFA